MVEYLILNALKLGIAAGIIGAFLIFELTLTGIYGKSKAYKIFESTAWGGYGYTNTWKGAFIGLFLGFIHAGLIVGITALIYNLIL